MTQPGKLPPIKFEALASALLAMAESLCAQWLPGGVQRGHEYVCGGVQGGAGTSCSVNLTAPWCLLVSCSGALALQHPAQRRVLFPQLAV